MTGKRAHGRAIWAVALLLTAGCGQKYDLPPQPEPALPPPPGYSKFGVWTMRGLTPTDLFYEGGLVFVAQASSDTTGKLTGYFAGLGSPQTSPDLASFEGLVRADFVTTVTTDSTFVIVADADTVKRYAELGGPPLLKFTDSAWSGGIAGLAADKDLNVYVSYGNRVVCYDYRGRRDHTVADNSSGSGQVQEPRGLHLVGSELLVADARTGLIARLIASASNRISSPAIDTPQMNSPNDVTADPSGKYIYVTDTGNNRVLKFDFAGGALVDSVYTPNDQSNRPKPEPALERPSFLSAADPFVYVSDQHRRVVVFRYSNQ